MTQDPGAFNLTLAYPERDNAGCPPLNHPLAYASPFLPQWPSLDTPFLFSCSRLNLAAKYLRAYSNQPCLRWYWVVVSFSELDLFFQRLQQEFCNLLPFWCWCHPAGQPHRHGVVVSSSSATPSFVQERLFQATRIPNRFSLMLLLFNLGRALFCVRVPSARHYYMNLSLPEQSLVILSCVWKSGLTELIEQLLRSMSWNRIESLVCQTNSNEGRVPLCDLPGMPQTAMLLPVDKGWLPTCRQTNIALHFPHSTIYFEQNLEGTSLPELEWRQKQVEGGHCLDIPGIMCILHQDLLLSMRKRSTRKKMFLKYLKL